MTIGAFDMGWVVRLAAIVGTVTSIWVAPAAAQEVPETGGRVFGLAGGSFGDGSTTVMAGGGGALRITRRLGIDFEFLYVPNLEAEDRFIIQTVRLAPTPAFEVEHDADLTTFLTKFTVDFPVTGDRLFPYVTGGGIAHLTDRLRIRFNNDRPRPLQEFGVIRPRILPPPQFDVSETGLALTVGGGLDVRLWQGLGVGADVWWLRVLSNRTDLDVATVAGRVSYRL